MTRSQWLLAVCGVIAGVNAVRQALFATAAVGSWLAILSAGVAVVSAAAFLLLRRRHAIARPALVAFGLALPLATILGSESLLANAVSLPTRLPGYLAASILGLVSGQRRASRTRSGAAPRR